MGTSCDFQRCIFLREPRNKNKNTKLSLLIVFIPITGTKRYQRNVGEDASGHGCSQGQRSLPAQGCGRSVTNSGGKPGPAKCYEVNKVQLQPLNSHKNTIYVHILCPTMVPPLDQLTINDDSGMRR